MTRSIAESADLLFHLLVLLKSRGVSLERVVASWKSRHTDEIQAKLRGMPILAFAAVLLAALSHATWNLLRQARGRLAAFRLAVFGRSRCCSMHPSSSGC